MMLATPCASRSQTPFRCWRASWKGRQWHCPPEPGSQLYRPVQACSSCLASVRCALNQIGFKVATRLVGKGGVCECDMLHSIQPEYSEIVAIGAPGNEQPPVRKGCEGQGPNPALSERLLGIAIGEGDHRPRSQRCPQKRG